MNIRLQEGLPFVPAVVGFHGQSLILNNVLLDTGSAGSIFSADRPAKIDLSYAPEDELLRIRGVGGVEFVFTKFVDHLAIGELQVNNFKIEVGAVDYGFSIDGILGMDFLIAVGAIIDLDQMKITTAHQL
jgi:hypothetical protein